MYPKLRNKNAVMYHFTLLTGLFLANSDHFVEMPWNAVVYLATIKWSMYYIFEYLTSDIFIQKMAYPILIIALLLREHISMSQRLIITSLAQDILHSAF